MELASHPLVLKETTCFNVWRRKRLVLINDTKYLFSYIFFFGGGGFYSDKRILYYDKTGHHVLLSYWMVSKKGLLYQGLFKKSQYSWSMRQ